MQSISTHRTAAPEQVRTTRQDQTPTLVIMEIGEEEAERWDEQAERRPGFQIVG